MNSPAKIFISYRRQDSDGTATLLKEHLARAFGDDQIFMDTQSIRMGDSWPDSLQQALEQASVLLVVIGRSWLRIADEHGRRRIDKEDDWVRKEIESGLGKKRVIPVLVGQAKLPPKEALPPSISGLVDQQAVEVKESHIEEDIKLLIERLEELGCVRRPSSDKKEQGAGGEAQFIPVPALHQLPPPPRDFIGRTEELGDLLAQMEQGGVSISGLQGMGGIGKTALALKLAGMLSAAYPDAQFYIDLRGASPQPLSSVEVQSHIIRAYHPTARLPESEAELSAVYQSVLHGQRALLLLDNASDAKQVESLLPPSTCGVIVTSRNHFTLPGLYAKRLDTLPEQDAIKLLLEIAPRIADQAAAMAGLCGYLPLALRLAAKVLAERITLKVADYIKRLEDAQLRLSLVDASVSLSYELLSESMQKNWRVLAVFPDTFDSKAAAAVWAVSSDEADEMLGRMVAISLLEWNEATDRYSLHDLVRLYADSRMVESERAAGQRQHSLHYLEVIRKAQRVYLAGAEGVMSGLSLFDVERGNIEVGQSWAAAKAKEDDEAASVCSRYPFAGAYVLDLRKHPRERIIWMESAVEAARRVKDRETEGANLCTLGLAYADIGESKLAIQYYEQYLRISREIGDRRGEGNALGNMGLAYATLGETRRAIEYYEQALVIDREIGDRLGEGSALGNMGVAYKNLGETKRAIEYYEQYLNIAREIGDRLGEGNALGNWSVALDKLGQREEAIALAEEALQIFEQLESPHAAIVRRKLAEWKVQG